MAKIGVDAVPLQKLHGGVSYYIFHLLDELITQRSSDTFYLFSFSNQGDLTYFNKHSNAVIVSLPSFSISHSIWSQTALAYGCWREKIDIFWGTTQSIPLIKKKSLKTVMALYDFVYLLYPETMSLYKRIYLRLFSRLMLKRADEIIPISTGSALKLQQFYGLKSKMIIQPPMKPSVHFIRNSSDLQNLKNKDYLVIIGTFEPRKNIHRLINIYMNLLSKGSADELLPLVVIGGGGWKNKGICQIATEARTRFPMHFYLTGYLSNDKVAVVLSGARYLIMVSQYEGYGMPIAEARMCKTMPICLDLPEMKEAAENDGIFLNPTNWESEIAPYLLKKTEIICPKPPQYVDNRVKAEKLSSLLDALLLNRSYKATR